MIESSSYIIFLGVLTRGITPILMKPCNIHLILASKLFRQIFLSSEGGGGGGGGGGLC